MPNAEMANNQTALTVAIAAVLLAALIVAPAETKTAQHRYRVCVRHQTDEPWQTEYGRRCRVGLM